MQNGPKPIMRARQPRRAASFVARSKRWTPSAARPEPGSQTAQRNYERYLTLARAEALILNSSSDPVTGATDITLNDQSPPWPWCATSAQH
jgi:hypothetical protein